MSNFAFIFKTAEPAVKIGAIYQRHADLPSLGVLCTDRLIILKINSEMNRGLEITLLNCRTLNMFAVNDTAFRAYYNKSNF